jgi:SEC-C motif domain protein
MIDSPICPCGSNIPYTSCCLPILDNHGLAVTAEALMRSRYTAFVRKHEHHILASWYHKNRPEKLNFEDYPVVWLGLEIHEIGDGLATDDSGMVEFTATYLENGQISKLREKSRFVRENDLWYYLGGECSVKRQKIERNGPCPCGSGKKFKRCCLLGNTAK